MFQRLLSLAIAEVTKPKASQLLLLLVGCSMIKRYKKTLLMLNVKLYLRVSLNPFSYTLWWFLLHSFHIDNCYLKLTILEEHISSCSCGLFFVIAALFCWFSPLIAALSIRQITMPTITPFQNSPEYDMIIPKTFPNSILPASNVVVCPL